MDSNPSDAQYQSLSQVGGEVTTTSVSPKPAPVDHGGTIPFTGMDLVTVLLVVAAMIATGVAMNWLSRKGKGRPS